jgi:competence protein CoiA
VDLLLTAITSSGRSICLPDIKNYGVLHKMREEEQFFCPECKEKLILKIGSQKVPHFAHYRVVNCSRYENESSYHLAGKEKLYLWLKTQGLQPQLELYDAALAQRPDICFHVNNQKIAVEFQCSTIPESLMRKRTNSYRKNHYYPIWILGGNQLKRKNTDILSISSFQYLFLTIKDGKSSLLFYCPNSDRMIFIRQITPVTLRNAAASISIKQLKNVKFLELCSPPIHTSFSIDSWKNEIKHFKDQYPLSPKAFSDPFLCELYQNHLHLSILPPEIGLPVPSSPFIKTPPMIWQGFIYIDVLQKLSLGSQFSVQKILLAFAKRVRKKQIVLREFPLGKGDITLPIKEYLSLLVDCQLLIARENSYYQLARNLNVARNMFEQKTNEDAFYQKYQKEIDLTY